MTLCAPGVCSWECHPITLRRNSCWEFGNEKSLWGLKPPLHHSLGMWERHIDLLTDGAKVHGGKWEGEKQCVRAWESNERGGDPEFAQQNSCRSVSAWNPYSTMKYCKVWRQSSLSECIPKSPQHNFHRNVCSYYSLTLFYNAFCSVRQKYFFFQSVHLYCHRHVLKISVISPWCKRVFPHIPFFMLSFIMII